MYELAKETKGAMYLSEHRYYGKSIPFDDLSTENLKYLSSKQALADVAKLIEEIKLLPQFKSSKVVVVGGSYAGNLATWMELLYPQLIDAAIASSAPVVAKKDFYEYLENVSEDFEQHGTPNCLDKIAEIFKSSLYGPTFNEQRIEEGVKNTNELFGGLKPNVSNVVFVNGELDPYHKLGVLEDVSYDAPAK
ncbi:thymus-specific serine protease-like [Manduca sexta]|uniref:thymus-specific serine protease-like n=1 Tax=Manduca sexta TaxID=7130 RepID=UPI00188FBCCA|nr:thymus-specific serine protease-like [Manduca sexta]